MKDEAARLGRQAQRRTLRKRIYKYRILYILALPAFVYLIINNYMPMIGLSLAFKNYSFAKGIFASPWNGISNFTYLFGSKWAKIMFRNTIGYNLLFIALGTVFAIFVAIVLGEVLNPRAKKIYQTLSVKS